MDFVVVVYRSMVCFSLRFAWICGFDAHTVLMCCFDAFFSLCLFVLFAFPVHVN